MAKERNYLIGTKNITSQTVLEGGIINLGPTYRIYEDSDRCGIQTFDASGTSVTLNWTGIYKVTATLVGTGTEAGDVTVQLLANGVPVAGEFSTETITTPDTELRTFTIDTFILVDNTRVLNVASTLAQSLSLQNTGVGATFTKVTFNVVKDL